MPVEALVLDLSGVGSSIRAEIAVIIGHLRSATRNRGIFCIGGMSQTVKDIFDVIHLQKAMPLFETREAALEAIAQKRLPGPNDPLFTPAN